MGFAALPSGPNESRNTESPSTLPGAKIFSEVSSEELKGISREREVLKRGGCDAPEEESW
jgi:hypothetical protein